LRILGMAGQLLGRAKQSTPRSPQGARLSARGVDGERACRAIIAVPMNALRNAPKPGCVQRRFDSPWSKGPCNPQPPDNPNGTRLSPMSSVRSVTYVSGPDMLESGSLHRLEPPTARRATYRFEQDGLSSASVVRLTLGPNCKRPSTQTNVSVNCLID